MESHFNGIAVRSTDDQFTHRVVNDAKGGATIMVTHAKTGGIEHTVEIPRNYRLDPDEVRAVKASNEELRLKIKLLTEVLAEDMGRSLEWSGCIPLLKVIPHE